MIETKARNAMTTPEVVTKRKAAEEWCQHASAHAAIYGGKPWRYVLLPHDVVAENRTLAGLTQSRQKFPKDVSTTTSQCTQLRAHIGVDESYC